MMTYGRTVSSEQQSKRLLFSLDNASNQLLVSLRQSTLQRKDTAGVQLVQQQVEEGEPEPWPRGGWSGGHYGLGYGRI